MSEKPTHIKGNRIRHVHENWKKSKTRGRQGMETKKQRQNKNAKREGNKQGKKELTWI